MDSKNLIVNLTALAESFIENNSSKLDKVNNLLVRIVKKDGSFKDEEVEKMKLSESLIDIFSNRLENVKEVNVYYMDNGIKTYINGINIF